MIKWLFRLFKPKKSHQQQIVDTIKAHEEIEYMRGLEFANYIWNASPPSVARPLLIRKMGELTLPYEQAIFDFLEKRNGVK